MSSIYFVILLRHNYLIVIPHSYFPTLWCWPWSKSWQCHGIAQFNSPLACNLFGTRLLNRNIDKWFICKYMPVSQNLTSCKLVKIDALETFTSPKKNVMSYLIYNYHGINLYIFRKFPISQPRWPCYKTLKYRMQWSKYISWKNYIGILTVGIFTASLDMDKITFHPLVS